MGFSPGVGIMDCCGNRRMDAWLGRPNKVGETSLGKELGMTPVQLFSWFPPSNCITPAMHKFRVLPWITILATLLLSAYWSIDRVVPIQIIKQEVIPQGRPGEQILVEALVSRDFDPACSVDVSRTIVTASGYRFAPEAFTYTQEALAASAEQHPDRLRVAVQIPIGAPKGRSVIHTTLTYHCNPLDRVWPIKTTTRLVFEVI